MVFWKFRIWGVTWVYLLCHDSKHSTQIFINSWLFFDAPNAPPKKIIICSYMYMSLIHKFTFRNVFCTCTFICTLSKHNFFLPWLLFLSLLNSYAFWFNIGNLIFTWKICNNGVMGKMGQCTHILGVKKNILHFWSWITLKVWNQFCSNLHSR